MKAIETPVQVLYLHHYISALQNATAIRASALLAATT